MAHNKTKEVTASQQFNAAKPLLMLLHGTSGFQKIGRASLALYLKAAL